MKKKAKRGLFAAGAAGGKSLGSLVFFFPLSLILLLPWIVFLSFFFAHSLYFFAILPSPGSAAAALKGYVSYAERKRLEREKKAAAAAAVAGGVPSSSSPPPPSLSSSSSPSAVAAPAPLVHKKQVVAAKLAAKPKAQEQADDFLGDDLWI